MCRGPARQNHIHIHSSPRFMIILGNTRNYSASRSSAQDMAGSGSSRCPSTQGSKCCRASQSVTKCLFAFQRGDLRNTSRLPGTSISAVFEDAKYSEFCAPDQRIKSNYFASSDRIAWKAIRVPGVATMEAGGVFMTDRNVEHQLLTVRKESQHHSRINHGPRRSPQEQKISRIHVRIHKVGVFKYMVIHSRIFLWTSSHSDS